MQQLKISRSAVASATAVSVETKTGTREVSASLNKWCGEEIIKAIVAKKGLTLDEGESVEFKGTVLRVGTAVESSLVNEETGELLTNTSVTLSAINNKAIALAQPLIDEGNFAGAFDRLMLRGTILNAPDTLQKKCVLTATITGAVTKEGRTDGIVYDGTVLNFKIVGIQPPLTVNHGVEAVIAD
jgi:hypothetical protein